MAAESVDDALESVFDLMVLDPAMRKHSFQKKHAALAAVRRAYREFKIAKGRELCERVILKTPHHTERFDFAVTNSRAVQLTQTWSFQAPDQATLTELVKAWGWTVQEALHSGGCVCAAAGEFDVGTDVDVAVVYVPEFPTRPASAFVDAQHIFEQLGVRAVSHDQAGDVAQRARELLGPLKGGSMEI